MKLSIMAHTNAKKPRVERDESGITHVYVAEKPLKGRANQAIIALLAKHFQTKKSNFFIVRGHKSKNKIIECIS